MTLASREAKFCFDSLLSDHSTKESPSVFRYEGNQVVIPASPLITRIDLIDLDG